MSDRTAERSVTYRACPYDGYFGSRSTFSAPGVFARDSAGARLVAEALLGRCLEIGDGRGLRVGVVREPFFDDADPFFDDADPGVSTACERALQSAGWATEDVAIDNLEWATPAALARLMADVGGLANPEVLATLSPGTRAGPCAGRLISAWVVPAADRVRAATRRTLATLFDRVDILAWPTTPTIAPAEHLASSLG